MTIKDVLVDAGINLQLVLAGFWGGVVAALAMRKASFIETLSIVIAGMASANYLGDVAVRWTGAPVLATGFVVGLGGMAICKGIIKAASAFRFRFRAGADNVDGEPWNVPWNGDADK